LTKENEKLLSSRNPHDPDDAALAHNKQNAAEDEDGPLTGDDPND